MTQTLPPGSVDWPVKTREIPIDERRWDAIVEYCSCARWLATGEPSA